MRTHRALVPGDHTARGYVPLKLKLICVACTLAKKRPTARKRPTKQVLPRTFILKPKLSV